MSAQNLAISWIPVLFDSPEAAMQAKDLIYQTRVIETILLNFEHIFDVDE